MFTDSRGGIKLLQTFNTTEHNIKTLVKINNKELTIKKVSFKKPKRTNNIYIYIYI